MPIPNLQAGELPSGEHVATVEEVESTFGIQNDRRKLLMAGLKAATQQFKDAGVKHIYVDGSFTTDKEEPADIDGCWSASGDIDATKLDADFWSFNDVAEFEKCRERIKSKYHLDFFIAEWEEGSTKKPFPEFFQTNRDGYPKGILKIELN